MKFISEFRDAEIGHGLARTIADEVVPGYRYRLMEFCGGHTHAIFRHGLHELFPTAIDMIHGPGCPVCVLPAGKIDNAVELALAPEVLLCSYGDTLRVPGSRGISLLGARAEGASVKMVYSPNEAVVAAQDNPDRQVVFFAIGFETTAPATAAALKQARTAGLDNFSIFCNHVLTPAAITNILESPQIRKIGSVQIDGFVGPAHVSTVIGTRPYEFFAEEYHRPVVIAGFEPLDILQAILMLVRQVNAGRAAVENQYTRAVRRDGNSKAKCLVAETFEHRRVFEWRGLGTIPYSALKLRSAWAAYDAEVRFDLQPAGGQDHPACDCGAILRGAKAPVDCRLFGTLCTPETPIGACMVSSEGACAAVYRYAAPARMTG